VKRVFVVSLQESMVNELESPTWGAEIHPQRFKDEITGGIFETFVITFLSGALEGQRPPERSQST
jgi:hypothetical protein